MGSSPSVLAEPALVRPSVDEDAEAHKEVARESASDSGSSSVEHESAEENERRAEHESIVSEGAEDPRVKHSVTSATLLYDALANDINRHI